MGERIEVYLPDYGAWYVGEIHAVRAHRGGSRHSQDLEVYFDEDDTVTWIPVKGTEIKRTDKRPQESGGAVHMQSEGEYDDFDDEPFSKRFKKK